MVKNYDNMLSRFHLIPERHGQTDSDGRTDGHTMSDRQYRASGTIFNDRDRPVKARL